MMAMARYKNLLKFSIKSFRLSTDSPEDTVDTIGKKVKRYIKPDRYTLLVGIGFIGGTYAEIGLMNALYTDEEIDGLWMKNPIYHILGGICGAAAVVIKRVAYRGGIRNIFKNYTFSNLTEDFIDIGISASVPVLSRAYLAAAWPRGAGDREEETANDVKFELENPGSSNNPEIIEIADTIEPGYDKLMSSRSNLL